MGEGENASMVEIETKRVDKYLVENLRNILDRNELKNSQAIFNAQSIIDALETTVTSEKRSAQILAYKMGPRIEKPSEEELFVYNLVTKSLSPRFNEQNSTQEKKTYSTDLPELTITWETRLSDMPGHIDNIIKLHREADIK